MKKRQKTSIREKVSLNDFQIAALAIAFDRQPITIIRWAKQGSDLLKLEKAQQVIKQFADTPNQIQPINI